MQSENGEICFATVLWHVSIAFSNFQSTVAHNGHQQHQLIAYFKIFTLSAVKQNKICMHMTNGYLAWYCETGETL